MYTTDVLKKRMIDGAYDAELTRLYPAGTIDAQRKQSWKSFRTAARSIIPLPYRKKVPASADRSQPTRSTRTLHSRLTWAMDGRKTSPKMRCSSWAAVQRSPSADAFIPAW